MVVGLLDTIDSIPVPSLFICCSYEIYSCVLHTCVKLSFSSPMYRILLRVLFKVNLVDMLCISENILISPFILVDIFAR